MKSSLSIFQMLLILLLFFGMFSLFIPLVVNEANMISNIDGKQFLAYYQNDIEGLQHTLIHYGIMPRGTTIVSAAKQAILKIIDFGMFSNVPVSYTHLTLPTTERV